MFQFVKDYILPIITVTVSFSSLLISLITLHSNRKRLDVEIENNLDDVNDIYFNFLNFTNSSSDLNFGNGKICFLKIVNPSPKDIAFFDLRSIDLKTNKANSFTRLDLAFYPKEKTKVLISFKVAISSLKNNKEAGVRKNLNIIGKSLLFPSDYSCKNTDK